MFDDPNASEGEREQRVDGDEGGDQRVNVRSTLFLVFSYLNMNLKWIKQRGDLCWLCVVKRELEPQQFELLQGSPPARILEWQWVC
jgi:hypothetical protein